MYHQYFGEFLSTFRQNNDTKIVPCQGFDTKDPKGTNLISLVRDHNNYLYKATAVSMYNLKDVDIQIIIN